MDTYNSRTDAKLIFPHKHGISNNIWSTFAGICQELLTSMVKQTVYNNLSAVFKNLADVIKLIVIAYVVDADLFLKLMASPSKHIIADPVKFSCNLRLVTDLILTH